MRERSALAAGLAAVAVLLFAVLCSAQFPAQMNYQVLLTNDVDEPLANQSVEMVFRIYEEEVGGLLFWSETQTVMTNAIGVASVILGSVTPMEFYTFGAMWLEVEVEGEILTPRRKLVTSPYSMVALDALHAEDADHLGEIPAEAYALDDDLYQPGTLNDPTNPLEWTKLKNMPAGFADGTDDVGTGVGGGGTANYVPKFTDPSTIQNSVIYENSGQVGIGTTTPEAKLTVEDSGSVPTLSVVNTSSASGLVTLEVKRTEDMAVSDDLVHLVANVTSGNGNFIRCSKVSQSGSATAFWVGLDGEIYATGGLDVTSETDRVIDAYSYNPSWETRVVSGVYAPGGGGTHDAIGVYGESVPQDHYGCGGLFKGGYIGAEARVDPTGSGTYYGLVAYALGGSGTNYAIWSNATGDSVNWAGYFMGDARVTGTFVNPGPQLEIDHPEDPENAYLRHALVASDEMKTVYDGTVVLDGAGATVVELPTWFEDLNGDFRYQLTPIGGPAPGLHVAETVNGGRFRIAGGEPGMTVSWQVTGVRIDVSARNRPLVVEQEKNPKDRGRYLTPEAFGAPREAGIGHVEAKNKHD